MQACCNLQHSIRAASAVAPGSNQHVPAAACSSSACAACSSCITTAAYMQLLLGQTAVPLTSAQCIERALLWCTRLKGGMSCTGGSNGAGEHGAQCHTAVAIQAGLQQRHRCPGPLAAAWTYTSATGSTLLSQVGSTAVRQPPYELYVASIGHQTCARHLVMSFAFAGNIVPPFNCSLVLLVSE